MSPMPFMPGKLGTILFSGPSLLTCPNMFLKSSKVNRWDGPILHPATLDPERDGDPGEGLSASLKLNASLFHQGPQRP